MTIDSKIELIPVDPTNPYPLGRAGVNHDIRNADHRALVQPPPRAARPNQAWFTRDVYNQGQSPQCAAEAAIGVLRTSPFRKDYTDHARYDTEEERRQLYLAAQQVDPWPGSNYAGTSTDAPFRVLRDAGVITAWKWLFGETELREYVTWYGPAVVGTIWHRDMFTPNADGYLVPGGGPAGGHAYRLIQFHAARQAYRVVNSWGRSWGQSGRAWIRSDHMAALLADNGEAATIG